MIAGEVVASLVGAFLPLLLATSIDVDPLGRVGQVSGLAAIQFRFAVAALVLLGVVVLAARSRRRAVFPAVGTLAFAASSGLATGVVAAGLMVALDGTAWPLNANLGDSGRLARWARDVAAGGSPPDAYPPALLHLMAWWSQLGGGTTGGALKAMQIGITAVFGPLTYLSWRLVLRPPWALGVGVVAALPLVDPYKPYTAVVLAVLIPVLVAFFQTLRGAAHSSPRRLVRGGVGFGLTAGLLFLTYSGWFVWSAAGAVVVTLVLLPWRGGTLRGLTLLGVTAVVFAAVAGRYLTRLLAASGRVEDRFFYFDVHVRPTYFAMWRTDLEGSPGPWPPPGELAGVGLFNLLLVLGLGLAIAVGRHRTVVIVLVSCLVSAWMLRFWFASQMAATGTVQLWPRTTQQILYCLLLLSGFGIHLTVRWWRRRSTALSGSASGSLGSGSVRAARHIGVLTAFLLLAALAGSAVADRYMPRHDDSRGRLAYLAQLVPQPDGTCSEHTSPGRCAPYEELRERLPHDGN